MLRQSADGGGPVSYIALATNNFEAVTDFYGTTLNFPIVDQWDRVNGRGRRFDLGGGLRLEILDNVRQRHPVTLEMSARVHVVIEVKDIHVAWNNVKVPAVPAPVETSWGARLFQIQDPDGVPVTYLEWTKAE